MKREESTSFDVFFGCFFGVWKRKKRVEKPSREQNLGKCDLFQVWGVPWAIYCPSPNYKATALQGLSASNLLWLGWSWKTWKGFDFLFLKRYGTWKSNGQIKSYGSRKLAVHRSVRHPGFCDISAVLTLILTHEYSLEWESDNLHNGFGFNPFWQLDQN